MGFDKKILDLSREFIRTEVVPYELTNQEKLTFILKNEGMIMEAIGKGHKASNGDEFQPVRNKIKKYRIELGIIKDGK
jgi:hypothetical protein